MERVKRSLGRGSLFTDAVLLILDRIRQQPDFYPVVKKDVRQAIVAKYPYCVCYREDDQTILVISIFSYVAQSCNLAPAGIVTAYVNPFQPGGFSHKTRGNTGEYTRATLRR